MYKGTNRQETGPSVSCLGGCFSLFTRFNGLTLLVSLPELHTSAPLHARSPDSLLFKLFKQSSRRDSQFLRTV